MKFTLHYLLDDEKCYELIRHKRWPSGICCPYCSSSQYTKQGHDSAQPARQKYRCSVCLRYFDDLTGTILAGHHQPLRVWVLCLYFMGLNLSNKQIAKELGLNYGDVQRMTEQLRTGIVEQQSEPVLSGTVECDEVYIVAGHKGNPEMVRKKNGSDGVAD